MLSSIAALGLKIFPLYVNIALGFLAVKRLGVRRQTIAPLIVYILAPAVVFNSTLQVKLDKSVLLIPLAIFILSAGLCFFTLLVARKIWSDNTKNLAAFSAGTGNTGYFGIPLAFILLPPDIANMYVLALVMSFLYEYTIGFYIMSRGSYTFCQSVIEVVKLPVLYAAIAGFCCNIFEVNSDWFIDHLNSFKGAYSTLGMMMVGMGLAGIKGIGVDKKFISVTLLSKFVMWPLAAFAAIYLDKQVFHALNESAYQVIIVYSIVPMAANTAIMATLFKARPEQTSFAVLLSTLLAFFTIPIMAALFL